MKKLIYIILASLLFFSCASTESEIETVKDEVSPIIEESTEIENSSKKESTLETELLNNESKVPEIEIKSDIEPEKTLEEIPVIDNNAEHEILEESTNILTSNEELLENQEKNTSTPQALLIKPENYNAPDYVEFLPIPENKTEETEQLESSVQEKNQIQNDIIDFNPSDSIENDENLDIVPIDNVENQENTYEQEFFEEDFTVIDTDEINIDTITQDNLIIEDENLSTNTDFIIDENLDNEIVENLLENDIETENNLTAEESELSGDFPETEDIPLEEIFTPDENFIPLEPEDTAEIEPTRTMDIKKNQILQVSFPGTGWLFLGDEYNSDTLTFEKRDIYETQTDFQLKSVQSGTALLHFFKQDMLTNEAINDYLLVTVNNRTGRWEVVNAPDYVFTSLEDEIIDYEEYSDSEYDDYYFIEDEPEVIVFEDNLYFVDDSISKKEIIDLAESFYQDDFYYETLDQLNYYFEVIGDSTDEYTDYALFLKGQLLEKQSPIRNIKESLTAYKQLITNFPDSKYWDSAKQRVTYLERFYFNVR